jgi:nucleoside-diphosphate-sugar epimerase
MKRVAVIGANSNAARAFASRVAELKLAFDLTGFGRAPHALFAGYADYRPVESYADIGEASLAGFDCVVNMVGSPNGDRGLLNALNGALPAALAVAAERAGARHFIQLSSLSIFGDTEMIGQESAFAPVNHYGLSKAQAETDLAPLDTARFAVTRLRLPILYSAGNAGKLGQLARLATQIGFIPSTQRDIRRSILSYANLATILCDLIERPASGPVFAADPGFMEPQAFAKLAPRHVRVFRLPRFVVAIARIAVPSLARSLFQSSVIDPEQCHIPSHWPLHSAESGLKGIFPNPSPDN